MAQALLQTLERSARDAGLRHVTAMNVELGPHAGVAPEALAFALQVSGTGTIAEGASVMFSGPGAEETATEQAHEHARHHHDTAVVGDLDTAMESWTVRLTWIEGT